MNARTRRWLVIGVLIALVLAVAVGSLVGPADAAESEPVSVVAATDRGAGSGSSDLELDRYLRDERIVESSGLAASIEHPGVLWTHNDSGHPGVIFAVGDDGETEAGYTLDVGDPRDWEAMSSSRDAEGNGVLWVGDIGDNSGLRTNGILVHRVREPTTLSSGTLTATSYRLRYPDRPQDAEALLVHPETGRLYVVTKGPLGGRVYIAPERLSATAPNELEEVRSAPPIITDGVFLRDGRAVLRDYSGIYVLESLDDPSAPRERVRIDMPQVSGAAPQAESVAVGDGDFVLVGSEGVRSPVLRVPIPGAGDTTDETTSDDESARAPSDSAERSAGSPIQLPEARVPLVLALLGGGLALWLALRKR